MVDWAAVEKRAKELEAQDPEKYKPLPTGGERPTRFQAATSAILDTGTLGGGGPFTAGVKQGMRGGTPVAAPWIGAGNVAGNWVGKPTMGSDLATALLGSPQVSGQDVQTEVDTLQNQQAEHPLMSLIGSLIGAAPGGLGTAKIGIGLLDKLARGGVGSKLVADLLGNQIGGRVATATATGAGEGALTAHSKGENVGEGSLYGAAGGGVAQGLLGEMLPSIVRAFTNSSGGTAARKALGDRMLKSLRTTGGVVEQLPRQALIDEARRLGKDATLADVNQGALDAAQGHIMHPGTADEMYPLTNIMEKRLGVEKPGVPTSGESAFEEFESKIRQIMPPGARSKQLMERNTKDYMNTLKSQFDAALDQAALPTGGGNAVAIPGQGAAPQKLTFDAFVMNSDINKAFAGDSLTKAMRDTRKTINDRFIDMMGQNPDNYVNGKIKDIGQLKMTPREVHALRTELDDMLNEAYSGTSPNMRVVRALTQARNSLSDQLNTIPGFKAVNDTWSSAQSYKRSYDLGSKLLGGGKDSVAPDVIDDVLKAQNPGDNLAFTEGVVKSIEDMMEKAGGESRTMRKIARDDKVGKQIRSVFGDAAGNQMINAANAAIIKSNVASQMVRGSKTAGVTAAKEGISHKNEIFDKITLTGALFQIISKAAGTGAARRLYPDASNTKYTKEMARLLSSQGHEAMGKNIDQIQQAVDTFRLPVALGGVDKAMANQGPKSLVRSLLYGDMGSAPAHTISNATTNWMLDQ